MDFPSEGKLVAYRLGHAQYPIFDGGGAFRFGSRWCTPGRRVIHAASTYSLAVLENLVHWRTAALPPRMRYVRIVIPAEVSREVLEPVSLAGWDAYPYGPSQAYGNAWYDAQRSALLIVPSVLSPHEPNLLISERHPELASIATSKPAPAVLDPRLVGAGARPE